VCQSGYEQGVQKGFLFDGLAQPNAGPLKPLMLMDTQELKRKADSYNKEHREGPVARTIEEYTAKLPSDTFLWAAIGSMVVSASFKLMGRNHEALFVGQWAPSFLLFGIYNKIVKVEGSDKSSKKQSAYG
jgi:hypothetical protein